ncbi:sugar-binding transcriptional regulator [Brevibacillus sp. NRS-1366]|uniref:sugar-binding transcriptional regulator n=1 Tax=Brevibacillus sp. NRS-1366 TaxID=3233899 RepID=UPI003D1A24C2
MLIKIAHYYYKQGLTQDEIAKKLSISRQKVNRLSQRLIEEGIVKIEIVEDGELCIELENKLENTFELKQAIVVPIENNEFSLERLGKAGANYINNLIQTDTIIGVSWGKTLSSVAKHLVPNHSAENVSVIQLVGGLNSADRSSKADEITRSFASQLGGTPYLMYAPAVVKNKEMKDGLMSEQSIQQVFAMIQKCHVAMVGIGELDEQATLFKENYLELQDLNSLQQLGCVGDICSRFFNLEGEIKITPQYERVIGISPEELKKIPLVIGIAGGDKKVDAIVGALRSGYLDVFITDDHMAAKLLESF